MKEARSNTDILALSENFLQISRLSILALQVVVGNRFSKYLATVNIDIQYFSVFQYLFPCFLLPKHYKSVPHILRL